MMYTNDEPDDLAELHESEACHLESFDAVSASEPEPLALDIWDDEMPQFAPLCVDDETCWLEID